MDELPARLLLDALPHPAAVVDAAGSIVVANAAFASELCTAAGGAGDLAGTSLERPGLLVDPTLAARLLEAARAGGGRMSALSIWRPSSSSGEPFELTAGSLGKSDLRLLLLAPSGPVERLQAELRRADRLAALGKVCAGIAHDIGNQLTATHNIAAMLLEDIGEDPRFGESLGILDAASREAARLVRRMLGLAGRTQPSRHELEARALAEGAIGILRHELPPGERLNFEPGDARLRLLGDPQALDHALIALLLRAVGLAGDRGAVAFRVSARAAGATCTAVFEVAAEPVEASPRPARDLAGDLSAVPDRLELLERIAADHRGRLERSESGGRDVVRLVLPALEEPARAERPAAPATAAVAPGQRSILLFDLQAAVRGVSEAMLERLGCTAVLAGTAQAALDLAARADLPLAAALLDGDVQQPPLLELVAAIRRLRPALPLLVSGTSGDVDARARAAGLPPARILEKPYSLARLRLALESTCE